MISTVQKVLVSVLSAGLMLSTGTSGQWKVQSSDTTSDLRGLCVVDENVIWASGTKGSYTRTSDGGRTWQSGLVPDAAQLDFRAVHALNGQTAFLLSIGNGEQSRIYKTTDAGVRWSLQYKGDNERVFLDAISFWDSNHGIALGDPIDEHFLILTTSDGGMHWSRVSADSAPKAIPNEGAFAASGTCLTVRGSRDAWFATGGGATARVCRSTDRGNTWMVSETPVITGDGAGIFSLAFGDAGHGVAVGGNYKSPGDSKDNVSVTADSGRTWTRIRGTPPAGYRSCVAYLPGSRSSMLIAVGPSGSDYSADGGLSWTSIDTAGYNSAGFASASAGWAVGPAGRIARFERK